MLPACGECKSPRSDTSSDWLTWRLATVPEFPGSNPTAAAALSKEAKRKGARVLCDVLALVPFSPPAGACADASWAIGNTLLPVPSPYHPWSNNAWLCIPAGP
ncbi:uncharacterized protein LOC144112919 [Amblyomma americanum]